LILLSGVIDATLLSESTCGNAQNGNSIRCASDAEKVEAVECCRTQPLLAQTKTQLGRWDVDRTWAAGLLAAHIQTADIVDLGRGMAACVVLNADDQASAVHWFELACMAGNSILA